MLPESRMIGLTIYGNNLLTYIPVSQSNIALAPGGPDIQWPRVYCQSFVQMGQCRLVETIFLKMLCNESRRYLIPPYAHEILWLPKLAVLIGQLIYTEHTLCRRSHWFLHPFKNYRIYHYINFNLPAKHVSPWPWKWKAEHLYLKNTNIITF